MRITRNQPVRKDKLEFAKKLRREATPAEKALWRALRNDQLGSLHFRRQQVIAGYIVDFYCATPCLVVEVDGGIHVPGDKYDQDRDKALDELGIKTLRISNESVVTNLPAVLQLIENEAKARLSVPLSRRERG